MWSQIAPAFRITLVMTILTGLIYPAVVTGVAQVMFPNQAHGSLVTVDGKVVGSELIGQNFAQAGILPPAAVGGGRRLRRRALERLELRTDEPEADRSREGVGRAVPAGKSRTTPVRFPPTPSPRRRAASTRTSRPRTPTFRPRAWPRRAAPTSPPSGRWSSDSPSDPWLGFVGESRVNVLQLNLALDQELPRK